MIIDDFDVGRTGVRPSKTDAVLIVDPNTVLSLPIAPERLKSIPRWNAEVHEAVRLVDGVELPTRQPPELARDSPASRFRISTVEQILSRRITKALDHPYIIARLSCYVHRRSTGQGVSGQPKPLFSGA